MLKFCITKVKKYNQTNAVDIKLPSTSRISNKTTIELYNTMQSLHNKNQEHILIINSFDCNFSDALCYPAFNSDFPSKNNTNQNDTSNKEVAQTLYNALPVLENRIQYNKNNCIKENLHQKKHESSNFFNR